MKKESAETLQWFVDFANMDLETIRPGDRAKLVVEAADYLFPWKEMGEFQNMPLTKTQLKTMAWALERVDKGSQEYWDTILRSQKSIRELFYNYLIPSVHPSPSGSTRPGRKPSEAPSKYLWGSDEFLWRVTSGYKIPYALSFLPITRSQDDYACFRIIRLLDGFPDHAIRVCPGCKKFFFNPTGRKKGFCSPRCMWRVNTAKRREADPEGYREYQKTLMRDRYREKCGRRRLKTTSRKPRSQKLNPGLK